MHPPPTLDRTVTVIAMLGTGIPTAMAYLYWLLRCSPKSDIAHVNAEVLRLGGTALSMCRVGTDFSASREPSYRKYEVQVRGPDGHVEQRMIGVAANLIFPPTLKEYSASGEHRVRPVRTSSLF